MGSELNGRVAVVTGATGGLGRVVAAQLARAGAAVALLGSDQGRLDQLAVQLALPADQHLTHAADLREPTAVEAAASAVAARFGQVHILAHLVGGWVGGTELASTPAEDLRSMLDQHVWSTFYLLHTFAPRLVAAGWGRVFVVSSPVTQAPAAGSSAYAAAKAAEEALVLTLAHETGSHGVTANVLQVRAIDAEHTRPEEIAAVMLFLCSSEGGRVNGARVPLLG